MFDTDNAEYTQKAYTSVLKALFPNSIHIGCLAHIQNLVGEAFRKPFDHVNTFMRAMNNMFFHAGARKFRYLQYMKDKLPTGKAKMIPNPVATRWSSWFDAAEYHHEHFSHYKGFIDTEITQNHQPPQSLKTVHEMLSDSKTKISLQVKLYFLQRNANRFFKC